MAIDLIPTVEKDQYWQPEKWSPRHRMIVALHASGLRNYEIAEQLNCSEVHVSVILNDPRAAVEIQQMAKQVSERVLDLHTRIKLTAHEAFEEVVDLMRTAEDPRVRQKSAMDILDRAGYTPVHKHLTAATEIPPELASVVLETREEQSENERYVYSTEIVEAEELEEEEKKSE